MSGNIRQVVDNLTAYPADPKEMTLRQAVEWWKMLYMADVPNPTADEAIWMNQRWAVIISAIGEREGVPDGFLSYILRELAMSEINMAVTAIKEAQSGD